MDKKEKKELKSENKDEELMCFKLLYMLTVMEKPSVLGQFLIR